MKNSFVRVLLVFIATVAFLSGCKKKDDPKPASKTTLLAGTTSKSWKLTAATASVFGTPINLFDANNGAVSVPTCKQDDIFTFSANKTYATTEGASDCGTPTTDSGTWSFNADETQLTLHSTTSGASVLPYSDVPLTVSFSGNTMQGQAQNVTVPLGNGSSITANVSVTFTAQ
jgi:hypothetical protein